MRQAINKWKGILASSNSVALVMRWARAIPLNIWLAAAALLLAALWLQEHDARVRAASQANQARLEAAQRVAALQAEAGAAVRAANEQNARAIYDLENQRRQLAGRASLLDARLLSVQRQRRAGAEEIAAMSVPQLAEKIAQTLGPLSIVRGASRPASQPPGESPHAPFEIPGPASGGGGASQATLQARGSAGQLGSQPAAAAPLPQPGQQPANHGLPATAGGLLELTAEGQRKVAAALIELDTCRSESALLQLQAANCRAQLSAGEAEIRAHADSLARLNQALAAKDRILAAREAEFKAELGAARGTWRARTLRALKFVGLGVGIGMAMR